VLQEFSALRAFVAQSWYNATTLIAEKTFRPAESAGAGDARAARRLSR
jgi:hypothetical protein